MKTSVSLLLCFLSLCSTLFGQQLFINLNKTNLVIVEDQPANIASFIISSNATNWEVITNAPWLEVGISTPGQNTVFTPTVTGSINATIIVRAKTKNTGASDRNATVTIRKAGVPTKTLPLVQKHVVHVSMQDIFPTIGATGNVPINGVKYRIPITTDGNAIGPDKNISAFEVTDAGWLRIDGIYGSAANGYYIGFTAFQNTTAASREVTIKLKSNCDGVAGAGTGTSDQIVIRQALFYSPAINYNGFSISDRTPNSIKLTASRYGDYHIYYRKSTGGGDWTFAGDMSQTKVITGLDDDKKYCFRIEPYNSNGGQTNPVSADVCEQ